MNQRWIFLLLALALGIAVFAGGLMGPAYVSADPVGLWPAPSGGEEKPVSGQASDVKQPESAGAQDEIAVLETSAGRIVLRFFPDVAPNHVDNFKKLAREKFYDGTKFHRVIKGFMIQGGDPNTKKDDVTKWGTGGPGYHIKAEFNNRLHKRGTLSMARAAHPDSAGSQFFICHADAPNLDRLPNKYTVFGEVMDGMDVVDKIATAPVKSDPGGNRSLPVSPVEIKRALVISPAEYETYKKSAPKPE